MAKFTYIDTISVNTRYLLFKLNYNYHSYVLYKKDIDSHFLFRSADKLSMEL